MQIRTRLGLRICIGVLYFLVFTADERCSPLHTDTHPPGAVLVRMYVRTELFRNSYTFFSASIHNLMVIKHPLQNPKQSEKTQTFRAAGNPKGLRPFWSF